ncbi:unnamed protein product [Closterium sp. NIES-64]|nr:unnamed protein product [Closterium sp. NIES-64]
MASRGGGSIGRGAGRAQGSAPGSPSRPLQGRVGDGPGGAGAIFVGGLLTVPAPSSRRSFRYDGPRPPPSRQTPTQPESGSEEKDEEEDGEGEKEEDTEGSGDDSEAAWDPDTHGGGEGGDDDDEDHEMDGLEPEGREEEVGEGGGRAATEAGSQHVREGGGSVGVKVGGGKAVTIREPRQRKKANKLRERAYPCTFTGEPLGEGVIAPEFLDEDGGSESSKGTGKGNRKRGWQVMMFGPLGADDKRQCKICTDRISWKQSTTTPGERHFASFHTAHMHVWHHRYHTPFVHLPGETFPRGGYKGVPDGYVYQWPHAKTWPQLAKGKAMATGGGDGSGGIERWMTTKLTSVQLRQAITKLVVTCDLPFRIVEAEAFRELLILLNRNCAQKNFIPSRWTVSRDTVVYAAAALQSAFAEMLAKEGELGCRVSFTIDMWTSPNNRAWLVVTGHWIDENYQLRTMGVSKADKAKMDTLRLTDADWETLHSVKTFLSPFAKVSKAAEGAAYPTVSMVLPYYNGLIDAMESRLAKGPSAMLKPMIEAALGEVIQQVRKHVAEYQARAAVIAPQPTPLAPVTEEEEGDAADDDEDAEFLPSRRRLAARLSASQEAGRGGMVQDDEVGRYLSERVRCDMSALEYWRSATNMQTLRRMARDYLAIPATSASSERVFSLGRNLISWKRHHLASQRTRASMILRSWYTSHPGQRIGEGRRAKGEGHRAKGEAPPEFAIEGEGEEEDDEWEEEGEEEQVGVGAGDTSDAEHAVVGSSSGVQA